MTYTVINKYNEIKPQRINLWSETKQIEPCRIYIILYGVRYCSKFHKLQQFLPDGFPKGRKLQICLVMLIKMVQQSYACYTTCHDLDKELCCNIVYEC